MAKTQTIDGKGNVSVLEDLGANDALGQPQRRSWGFGANQAAAHERSFGATLAAADRAALLALAAEAVPAVAEQ